MTRTPTSTPRHSLTPDPGFLEAWPVLLAAGLYFVSLGAYAGVVLRQYEAGQASLHTSPFIGLGYEALGAPGVVAMAFACAWILLVRAFQEFSSPAPSLA